MAVEDREEVLRILGECPEATQWSVSELAQLEKSGIAIWVVEHYGGLGGMVAARSAADEGEILNLAVRKVLHRRGLGRRLLAHAVAALRAAGARTIFLEVRDSNAGARAFYAKAGFAESYRRRAYYRGPEEDAIVMSVAGKR
jgi:ribosomal-protein-alanine N-acetyltransferase